MIINTEINITWLKNNKKYYIKHGYKFSNYGDYFTIKIEDLNSSSDRKIFAKCDYCGCEKQIKYREYLRNITHCNKFSCSIICANNKREETTLLLYGTKNCFQNEEIKIKSKKTNIIKYGTEYAIQNKNNREIINKTNLKKYGFEVASKNKLVSDKAINTMIEKYGEIFVKYTPRYNKNSLFYFDLISEKLNINIQHALNGGEKKFIRYFVDGYIQEYNICLEWDEKNHKYKKEKDLIRENYLINEHCCVVIRINEIEFLKNIDLEFLKIVNKINNIINKYKK